MKKKILSIFPLFLILISVNLNAMNNGGNMTKSQDYKIKVPQTNCLFALKNFQKNSWNIYRFREFIEVKPVTFFKSEKGDILSAVSKEKLADSRDYSGRVYILADMYDMEIEKLEDVYRAFKKITGNNFIRNVMCEIEIFSDKNQNSGGIVFEDR